jgi:hypothetical protein
MLWAFRRPPRYGCISVARFAQHRPPIGRSSRREHAPSQREWTTLIDNLLIRDRLLALFAGFFGIVALLLATIGLYGVLSYSVIGANQY